MHGLACAYRLRLLLLSALPSCSATSTRLPSPRGRNSHTGAPSPRMFRDLTSRHGSTPQLWGPSSENKHAETCVEHVVTHQDSHSLDVPECQAAVTWGICRWGFLVSSFILLDIGGFRFRAMGLLMRTGAGCDQQVLPVAGSGPGWQLLYKPLQLKALWLSFLVDSSRPTATALHVR